MDEWVRGFLTESPAHTGVVSTVRADGRPHAKPIFFEVEGADILFITARSTVTGKNLARDPRVTVCVEVEAPIFRYVTLDGMAALSTCATDPTKLRHLAGRLAARYRGVDQEQAMARSTWLMSVYLIRMTVTNITGARNV
jgi:PPOX class probable F420-dependent enzyme